MPLAGTPREQKHYREIREEYPEKGKEYAARVARNIVRANTPGGRKLKGTTEYGRNWGPPYSEPLSKKGAFYNAGCNTALEKVGLSRAGMGEALLNALKSRQYGEFMTRMPIQMATGGALGALTGSLSEHPLEGMGIGMLGGATSGFSVAAAPRLREMLIKRLQGVR
jgi:hypothetical protein